jgi:hypothetical protein
MRHYYVSDEGGWVVVLAKSAKNARKNAWRRFRMGATIVTRATKKEIAEYFRYTRGEDFVW